MFFKAESIHHAYEGALNCAVRLSLFASGSPTFSDGPIDERQKTLALEDLTNFSYHARRLLKLTDTEHLALSTNIKATEGEKTSLNIKRILGVIIHHEALAIIRTQFDLDLINTNVSDNDDMGDLLIRSIKTTKQRLPVAIITKSDTSKTISFLLKDLINAYQDRILIGIIEECERHRIYLSKNDE